MLKKVIIGGVSVVALGLLAFGKDVVSYAKTFGTSARAAIKAEVPIEFEIQRARDMVEGLIPEIRKCMHVIAEEEVNVEHLAREITVCEAGLGKQKDEILALKRDLDQGLPTYQYASRRYTAGEVKHDLACRFERYKTAETTVASKREILSKREQSLVAARQKLENMLNDKRTLEVEIESLEARVKQVQAAQSASKFNLDDSQLSRAKQLIADLNKQLDVRVKMLDAEGKFTGLIPVNVATQVPENLGQQIDEYFEQGGKVPAVVPSVAGIER